MPFGGGTCRGEIACELYGREAGAARPWQLSDDGLDALSPGDAKNGLLDAVQQFGDPERPCLAKLREAVNVGVVLRVNHRRRLEPEALHELALHVVVTLAREVDLDLNYLFVAGFLQQLCHLEARRPELLGDLDLGCLLVVEQVGHLREYIFALVLRERVEIHRRLLSTLGPGACLPLAEADSFSPKTIGQNDGHHRCWIPLT